MISYDAGAAYYDSLSGRWSRLYVPTLLAAAQIGPSQRLLDIATGTGEAAIRAAAFIGPFGKVIGIDVSQAMLTVAAGKITDRPVSLMVMDGQALGFKDESFDAVVCQFGLMFFPDAARSLEEWRRVLRRGGRLAVCVWSMPERVPLFGILMDVLSRHFPDERDVLYQPSALADAKTLEGLLVGSAFRTVRIIREIREHWFESFDDYWRPFEAGGGRHGQLYLRLPAMLRESVRDEVRERMAPFRVRGRLVMQAEVLFGTGER
jgi:ubiquinone/menaquinone biosynthesis C-methylase UbiE